MIGPRPYDDILPLTDIGPTCYRVPIDPRHIIPWIETLRKLKGMSGIERSVDSVSVRAIFHVNGNTLTTKSEIQIRLAI